jgi:MFS family permease
MLKHKNTLLILVASLGYFVDIFDLVLFNVVKKESLTQIMQGADAASIKNQGIHLFNIQMIGMLVGGIVWGIIGDLKGRLKVLFGSIILYSAANIVNAFTFDLWSYAVVRFIAGVGLAGELGAGITLITECMPTSKRGIGTMIVVTFGALGAIAAGLSNLYSVFFSQLIGNILGYQAANWQIAYIIGGTLGLLLLFLRVGTIESAMFNKHKQSHTAYDFKLLLKPKNRVKYLACILVGIPVWYVIGLIAANSQEIFAKAIGVKGEVINGEAVMYAYFGLSVGDFICGVLSQWLKSRKKAVALYLFATLVLTTKLCFFSAEMSVQSYLNHMFLIGLVGGYWAVFVTIAAEQFGTNVRSTVTNTVPNFVRGTVPIITYCFFAFTGLGISYLPASFFVGVLFIGAAFWANHTLKESFHKDLDYIEV